MAAQFQLVMRTGPNAGKAYLLEATEIIVGRDASNGIPINDTEVSRKHAKLSLHGSAYVIKDLGSTNGTSVNGQRISGTQALNPGDTVSFGENIVLIYETAHDPNATMVGSAKAVRAAAPVQQVAPPPPPPVPVYSGQAPAGPAPVYSAPAKKSNKTLLIVIGVVVVLCICAASVFLYFAPKSFWCILPSIWGPGACP